ncbi:MAG: cysteine desulfurase [Betaproteobacteria bacterium]|nr:cysteine desulfurase [Betaproteobacteria bacterium]MCH9848556.1 cysteine desulfurase [Betaproteobacteria bacterium]
MANVYFDHNSTTALKPQVLETMMPYMTNQHGNPASQHSYGRNAHEAIEQARRQVAQAVGAQANQIIFTASGTEANNFAITGIASNLDQAQLLTSSIEHPCVSNPVKAMQYRGWQANRIKVNDNCELDMQDLQTQLAVPTNLVSVMLANNETGAIQDIEKVVELAATKKVLVHTDAVQALGKIKVDFTALGVHAMTVSSHKIGGPLGAGALVLNKRVDIQPLLYGGGQEKGLRSGTENIAAIVGFGAACELASQSLSDFGVHTEMLRNQLEAGLASLNAVIFGQQAKRLPNTSFFAFNNIDGETLVTALDKLGFAVASGSACSSASSEPSHVLLAMGVDADTARGAIRVSFNVDNTAVQVSEFLIALKRALQELRQMTAVAA